jgi:hypothetical protein
LSLFNGKSTRSITTKATQSSSLAMLLSGCLLSPGNTETRASNAEWH